MKLELLKDGDRMNSLLKLYVDSFPEAERRPVNLMPPSDPAFRFYALGNAGFLTAWEFDGFTYIEHFAIYPHLRGNGLGSDALAAIDGSVILEVEPPESGADAAKRVRFYEHNGFRVLDCDYIQPPYSPGLPSVNLRLMLRGDLPVSVEEAIDIIRRRVYSCSDR